MLGLKKQLSVKSIIGPGMRVDGPVDFQDGLQIDGTVLGDVKANPDQPSLLVITETGSVQGAIRADHVVIGGSVVGPVQAAELLELQSKARVEGDVQYKALEMQQGAVIAGQLRPQLTPPPAQATRSPAARAEPTEPSLEPEPVPELREPTLEPEPEPQAKRDTRLF
ncbi:polymer-forming cytoskeletal protein [Ottowia sp.]|uniref:bactofilin family protein n=1 Tax=Ottowia sp. TaxID=1898956 RepID=UPI00261E7F3A|nr:polymer-forming cytoskeletal protein [Ottowia sp.]